MRSAGRPSHREALLVALPGTRNQIAERLSISAACVGRLIAGLLAEDAVYVVTHRVPKQGPKMPVFAVNRERNRNG
jgi:predicted ArsR family transcriptional regulator